MSAQPEHASSMRRVLDQPRGGPTVLRIVLGTHLRRLRESCGITREAAGEAIRGSHAKISRLELGRVGYKERDVADLLTLYGVREAAQREEFLSLARHANTPGWWHKYGDVLPSWFETLLGLEEAASIIRTYEVQFVPGLLQTADYARAVTMLGHASAPEIEIERRVSLRMRRQQLLAQPAAPKLWAVIDEAALRRPLGGVAVMRAQIQHLLDIAEQPNITLQVAPFRIGGLAAAGGPVTILRFLEPDLPDIVYLEQLTSALYLDKRTEVEAYKLVMDRLCASAETHQSTTAFLTDLLKEF
ncbi:helix-turn-helix domain-containing protein [Streptomyces gobiensis]|uniref:helix-turn-helix domain-containing protein n=1 Tax=Streptomyces gobiensis TaxID=2875706 RepID=UPI001E465862|nr:helix-turn-helix transcriptional regulator [Streptomyces gobiensis]UGY91538.1 helix-turn-helix domain-containing protein [Streptomyces gobiensis]